MKKIKYITNSSDITGLIPGVGGHRAFPTSAFKDSDPFLMLDHIGPDAVGPNWKLSGEGHDHPHRGFETITFMFEGRMNHRDSLGNRETLDSGSVQRMNAGAGIIHGGSMHADTATGRFHEMQLWVNNPQNLKMSAPSIHNVSSQEIPITGNDEVRLRVIAGRLNGLQGPIKPFSSVQIGHVISTKAGELKIDAFSEISVVMVYVMEGQITIGNQIINAFQLGQLTQDREELVLAVNQGTQALVLAGIPLREPVVFGGPFVMNTSEEIDQSYADFQAGRFGSIPEVV